MSTRPNSENYKAFSKPPCLSDALSDLKTIMHESVDLNIMEVKISNQKCAVIALEGMVALSTVTELIFRPLQYLSLGDNSNAEDLLKYLKEESLLAMDRKIITSYGEIVRLLCSGFVMIFIDGVSEVIALGVQGYMISSLQEPTIDATLYGSQIGFIDNIRTNISLVRRRIKSGTLKFEMFQLGKTSVTDVCLVYLTDKAPKKLIAEVKKRLSEVKSDLILTNGYLEPFLQGKPKTVFSSYSTTDRPDTLCAKINEGRVGILIDGVPFVTIIPSLFVERFQTVDDYATRPYYATYVRLVRYISFFITILLPGLYVAICTYHPEMLARALLLNLFASEEITPFSLFVETMIITFLYEILREAGLRLPKAVGGAASIVGGLIIGDAAVTSGIIGAPLLIIIGLSATTSFVISGLNQQTSILRYLFIIAGGLGGLFGIALVFACLLVNICAMEDFGVPFTAPVVPFTFRAMKDTFMRLSFKTLQKDKTLIQNLNGTNEK